MSGLNFSLPAGLQISAIVSMRGLGRIATFGGHQRKLHMKSLSALLLAFLAFSLRAQISSPEEFLGDYPAQFTPHHRVVDYFEYVAGQSPRVMLQSYGFTLEGRPLLIAIISTPQNLEKLEEIRLNHLRRAGLAIGEPTDDFSPAISWLSFGVHGNEAGATESSMRVLWRLAKGDYDEFLQKSIVIIDPSINPDGFSRYVNWYRSVSGIFSIPQRSSREHQEPWPGGRVNHYYFDLNRDWAWATQFETKQRLMVYGRWMPHVHVDFHEQYPDNPYYFAPAAQPFHEYITPWQADFQTRIGQNNAGAFDRQGWLYFTREIFDLLYPSYGDTYPTFNGAIGMTYEQAGHGISGRAILMENGDTLTLADRIAHHTTTALRTIRTAAEQGADLEEQFARYFRQAVEHPPGKYKAYVVSYSNGRDKLQSLTRLLDLHGIRYGALGKSQSLRGFDFASGEDKIRQMQAEDLLIPVNQPKGVLVQVLFEPHTTIPDSLTYDITAWALPFARGLDALAVERELPLSQPFVLESPVWQQPRDEQPYAYVFPWRSAADARFLSDLLQAGIGVRFAERPFTLHGQKFERGSLVVSRADNRKLEGFHRKVQTLVKKNERDMYAFTGGYSDVGPDLGSESMRFIRAPRVVIPGGYGVDGNAFGHTLYFFEQVLHYPVVSVETTKLNRLPLEECDVLVLPSGKYAWNEGDLKKLQSWLMRGGRLILLGQSVRNFAGKQFFKLKAKNLPKGPGSPEISFAERERAGIASAMPGAILTVNVDETHPLGFGLGKHYHLLKYTNVLYEYLESGWNVGFTREDVSTYGFIGQRIEQELPNSFFFGVQPMGKGEIVYLPDSPLFRAFWEQGFVLMANAVFF